MVGCFGGYLFWGFGGSDDEGLSFVCGDLHTGMGFSWRVVARSLMRYRSRTAYRDDNGYREGHPL